MDAAPNPEERAESEPPPEAEGMIGVAGLAIAIVLAELLPFVTHAQPASKAWFLSPRNAPGFGIAMVALAGLALGWRFVRGWRNASDPAAYLRRGLSAFGDLGPALGFTLLFCLYLFAVSWISFGLSTLLFGQACLWLAGLRGARWALWNLAFAIVVVAILRVGMGLWFPQAAIFQWLPAWFGNTLGPYL